MQPQRWPGQPQLWYMRVVRPDTPALAMESSRMAKLTGCRSWQLQQLLSLSQMRGQSLLLSHLR